MPYETPNSWVMFYFQLDDFNSVRIFWNACSKNTFRYALSAVRVEKNSIWIAFATADFPILHSEPLSVLWFNILLPKNLNYDRPTCSVIISSKSTFALRVLFLHIPIVFVFVSEIFALFNLRHLLLSEVHPLAYKLLRLCV